MPPQQSLCSIAVRARSGADRELGSRETATKLRAKIVELGPRGRVRIANGAHFACTGVSGDAVSGRAGHWRRPLIGANPSPRSHSRE